MSPCDRRTPPTTERRMRGRSGIKEDATRPGGVTEVDSGTAGSRGEASHELVAGQRRGKDAACPECSVRLRGSRDDARPASLGSYIGNIRGCCEDESDADLRRHRRPACVKAATQPRDGCAAGMRNGRALGALRPGCPRGRSERRFSLCECVPASETISGEQRLNPSNGSRSGKALVPPEQTIGRARLNPSGQTPGRLFGERGSILCSRSRIRGTGTLQVSRHETLEKPETALIIARTTERMEGFGEGNRPPAPGLLALV